MKDNSEKWWGIAVAVIFLAMFGGMGYSEAERHKAEGKAQVACIEQRGNWSSDRCTFSK